MSRLSRTGRNSPAHRDLLRNECQSRVKVRECLSVAGLSFREDPNESDASGAYAPGNAVDAYSFGLDDESFAQRICRGAGADLPGRQ
jgi:hypothetical protein